MFHDPFQETCNVLYWGTTSNLTLGSTPPRNSSAPCFPTPSGKSTIR